MDFLVLVSMASLCATHFCFALGSVLMKHALASEGDYQGLSPVIFSFYREIFAGIIMTCIAYYITGLVPQQTHILRILALGLSLFGNQLLYILGVDFAGVLVACCMQPVIPVYTTALAVVFGMEQGNLKKVVGILIAVAGAISMVIGSSKGNGMSVLDMNSRNIGAMYLVGNTFSMSTYFINVKGLSSHYPAVCLAAWAYLAASCFMGTTALLTASHNDWILPDKAWAPLLFWIFIGSVGCYFALTWAASKLNPSVASSFQCVQPFCGMLLAVSLLGEVASFWDLGSLAIAAGLFLVVTTSQEESTKQAIKPSSLDQ